jgi:hypothetical protein
VVRYVQFVLTPRVEALEAAALTANEQVLAYCSSPGRIKVDCTELPLRSRTESATTLLQALAVLASTFSGTAQALWQEWPPAVEGMPATALVCVVEDLTLFADGYARLLEETAQDVPSTDKGPVAPVEYAARVRSLAVVLDRAERWLETVDRAVGAVGVLPGFADGGQALNNQLSMFS